MILDVRCVATPAVRASTATAPRPAASLRVSGRNLGAAALVVFYGAKGERDDALAPASPATAGQRAHLRARRAPAAVPSR